MRTFQTALITLIVFFCFHVAVVQPQTRIRVDALAPQVVLHSLWIMFFLVFILSAVYSRCFLCDNVRSNVTPRYFA